MRDLACVAFIIEDGEVGNNLVYAFLSKSIDFSRLHLKNSPLLFSSMDRFMFGKYMDGLLILKIQNSSQKYFIMAIKIS